MLTVCADTFIERKIVKTYLLVLYVHYYKSICISHTRTV
jgi:hypothetical protein